MPAKKLKCTVCGHYFYAARADTKYCSGKCRYKLRQEDAKFKYPKIPQSGIEGITFKRTLGKWQVVIKEIGKYCGVFKTIEEAKRFQDEVRSTSTD